MRVDRTAAEQLAAAERVGSLAPMLADPDPVVRKSAVIALGRIPCPEATRALCACLSDPAEGVRVLACQALGRAADPASVSALLARTHDDSVEVRAGVLWALANVAAHGDLPGEGLRALFAPIVTMAFDPDDGVRADAAAVLGTLRDPRATDALVVLLEDACHRVRANACASLAMTDDEEGLAALLDVLAGAGENSLVVVSALDGVARRAERGSLSSASPEAARAFDVVCAYAAGEKTCASCADSGLPTPVDVRATAVWALGRVGGVVRGSAERVRGLLDEAAAGPDEWMRRYADEARRLLGIEMAPTGQ